jgi:hypothetical protein
LLNEAERGRVALACRKLMNLHRYVVASRREASGEEGK